MVRTFRKKYIIKSMFLFLKYFATLVLNLLKDIFERSGKPFNRFRASASKNDSFSGFCYITLFFVSICVVPIIFASEEELFLRANKYYAEKDYNNALQTYDMISKKGSAVLYNMGNCYFHQQDYPYALVHWSRAEVGANNDEYNRIQHNKKRALCALGKQKEQPWWQYTIEFLQSK